MTPYHTVYGRNLQLPINLAIIDISVLEVAFMLFNLQELWETIYQRDQITGEADKSHSDEF